MGPLKPSVCISMVLRAVYLIARGQTRLRLVVVSPTSSARLAIPSSAFYLFCCCARLSFSARRRGDRSTRLGFPEIPAAATMNWKFPIFGSAQQQQPQPNFQEIPPQSWYPPSVVSSPSHFSTPTSSSVGNAHQRAFDRPQSPSHVQPSPTEAAGIIARLKDKSVDELRKLLNDKEAYNALFNSLDQVKIQNNLRDELRKETLQLAKENLEKEPRILELRNQCTIIRTTELAAAQEKLAELERLKEETLSRCSPSALLEMLHDAMNKVEEESEMLHRQLLDREIDLPSFVQKYKKLRTLYHKRALLHLAAKTSGFKSRIHRCLLLG
ncbi:hypothetical protein OPV22_008599 [Ensete ventricosum]|uniref:VPS37 C-terminal domain-containing protein n=1 Tax=Ensete ventricosum TaxID=4639 RepID=A0AAV8RHC6_ENSVE|nr:hypothetical protein OPV22_008599 [Ensete ventricosum]